MIEKTFGNRLSNIEYAKRPGTYGVAFRQRGSSLIEVALIDTPRGRFLPGGGIETGEDHVTCLKREFIEESGFAIAVGAFIGVSRELGLTPRSKRYVELIGHFYLVDILDHLGGQVEKDHELIWVAVEEGLQSLRLSYQSYAVAKGLKLYLTTGM